MVEAIRKHLLLLCSGFHKFWAWIVYRFASPPRRPLVTPTRAKRMRAWVCWSMTITVPRWPCRSGAGCKWHRHDFLGAWVPRLTGASKRWELILPQAGKSAISKPFAASKAFSVHRLEAVARTIRLDIG